MKRNYNTSGKQKLLEFFEKNPDCQFTPEDICLAINGNTESKKSSLYRHLSELCEREVVRKFRSDERGGSVYQYIGESCNCRPHFHTKCINCGAIRHLDCDDSEKFAKHLLREHDFEIFCGQSMLYGLCGECRKKEGADA